jgi:hypothetical protein
LDEARPEEEATGTRQPYRVKLPGLVRDQDIGLGDVVTKATSALGIKPCGGCARRATALNRWVVLGGSGR